MAKQSIDLLRRQRIAGTLRMGAKTGTGNGVRPVALDKWRITSDDKAMLEFIAGMYGGKVQPWAEKQGSWELYTESDELYILLEPGVTEVERAYEFWSGGGCLRRCQGGDSNCTITDPTTGEVTQKPCFCDNLPEKEQCAPTSRVAFRLAGVPTFGPFNYASKGVFTAMELPDQIEALLRQFKDGALCILAITSREIATPGKPKKKFKVPVIRYRSGMAQNVLDRGGVMLIDEAKALEATASTARYQDAIVTEGRDVAPEEEPIVPEVVDDAPSVLEQTPEDIEAAFSAHELTASQGGELKQLCKAAPSPFDWTSFAVHQWKQGIIGYEALKASIHEKINNQTHQPEML